MQMKLRITYCHYLHIIFVLDLNGQHPTVTSVGAVYREEGERRVPVGVVGFQFDLFAMKRMFSKITSNVSIIPT